MAYTRDDEEIPKPSFLIIGAQKAGTTSLHEYLRTHPELYLPPAKEFSFFNLDPEGGPYLRHDPDRAARLGPWGAFRADVFEHAPQGAVCGYANPAYMAGAPRRSSLGDGRSRLERLDYVPHAIQERLPNVRIIATLRDPIERALSAHRMAAMRGRESRSPEQALRELLDRDALERARAAPGETDSYIVLGEYGRILAPFFERFGRDQILITSLERIAADPGGVTERVQQHIGVGLHLAPNLGQRYMQGADERRLEWLDIPRLKRVVQSNHGLTGAWGLLPASLRRRVLERARRGRYRLMMWNRRSSDEDGPQISEELREALGAHFESDALLLKSMTGMPPPW